MNDTVADDRGALARVLICAGSPVLAAELQRTLEYAGDIMVIEVRSVISEAIARLPRLRPDLVVIDIEQPAADGLAGIEEIMSVHPVPILALCGHARTEDSAAALAAGALDVIDKAALTWEEPAGAAADAFRHRVWMLSRAHVIRHPRARLRGEPVRQHTGRASSVIGICGSTGAPYVLSLILGGLPADYPIPILVVQHISPGFAGGLAHWLNQAVPLPVRMAADGALAVAGAWIAPEGAHLMLSESGRLCLDLLTVEGRHRPSGDVLFRSIAASAGDGAVAVVLTGMGSDGAAGAAMVRRRGGLAIAQDEQSSAIYGMPRAAAARGVDLVLSPGEIVTCLTELRFRPATGRV